MELTKVLQINNLHSFCKQTLRSATDIGTFFVRAQYPFYIKSNNVNIFIKYKTMSNCQNKTGTNSLAAFWSKSNLKDGSSQILRK